ncbi:MAG TPA: site-specific DNA-methyltransferase, partial [Anaerolineales bacterium]|nr:site-specific DNA-methyltransferase [Anaerolineales bacterium]
MKISNRFNPNADCILFEGDCLDLLKTIPDNTVKLVVTSPPYNLGKEYETRLHLQKYLDQQKKIITECVRIL